jgi:hypothetical protein
MVNGVWWRSRALETLENAARGRSANAMEIKEFGTSTTMLIARRLVRSGVYGYRRRRCRFSCNEITAWRARAWTCQEITTKVKVQSVVTVVVEDQETVNFHGSSIDDQNDAFMVAFILFSDNKHDNQRRHFW